METVQDFSKSSTNDNDSNKVDMAENALSKREFSFLPFFIPDITNGFTTGVIFLEIQKC